MKKDNSWRNYKGLGIMAIMVMAATIIIFFAFYRADSIGSFIKSFLTAASPIIYGVIIAYLLNPIMEMLEKFVLKRMKDPADVGNMQKARVIAVALSIIFTVIIVIFLLYLVLPTLIETISKMVNEIPDYFANVSKYLDERTKSQDSFIAYFSTALKGAVERMENWLKTDILSNATNLMNTLTSGIVSVLTVMFNVFIGLIVACYLLMKKERFVGMLKKTVYAIAKKEHANTVMKVLKKSNGIFGGFISGKLVDSLLLGVMCFLIMALFRMDYAVFISVLVGVCNLIPFFGQWISMLLGGALLLLVSPWQGVGFIIFIVILQQIDGNIIQPRIVGNSTGLSPFWVMFAIFIGGGLFGVPGMFLGVPTFGVIYYIIKTVIEKRLQKKDYPVDSFDYYELDEIDEETNEPIYYDEPEKKNLLEKMKESASKKIQEKKEEYEERKEEREERKEIKKEEKAERREIKKELKERKEEFKELKERKEEADNEVDR